MDQNSTKTKKQMPAFLEKICAFFGKIWAFMAPFFRTIGAHIVKYRYLYMLGLFVVVSAVLSGVAFLGDIAIADLEKAKLPTQGEGFMETMKGLLYNSKALDNQVFSLFQIIVRLVAIIGMMIAIAKTSGSYQIGFVPFVPAHPGWFFSLMSALVLLVPASIYTLFGYTWSLALIVMMGVSDAVLMAFVMFLLRKLGANKIVRVIVPMASVYLYYGIYLGIAMLGSAGGFSGMDILTLTFPTAILWSYVALAPLFMMGVYLMTNSVMAMIIPTLTLAVPFSLFHGVIGTFSELTYPIIFFLLGVVAILGVAGTMWTFTVIRLVKKVPLPTDLLCEVYEEGSPEMTYPEGYLESKAAKKEEKKQKKAKKSEFSFLDETPAEEAPAEETPAEEAPAEEEINA